MNNFALLILLILSISQYTISKSIVRWIHGINAPCSSSSLDRAFKDFDFKCVETGYGSTENFDIQITRGCNVLMAEIEKLKNGFTLLGVSQGGLIARGILQRCPVGQYLKRLITFGAPHLGVALVPFTSPYNPINIIAVKSCFTTTGQNTIGPCSYMRSLRFYDDYKKAHNTVYDLNNEGEIKQNYITQIKNLEVFMAIGFNGDKMIQPKVSGIFGFYKDTKYNSFVELEESIFYKEDRIGLKHLNENQKLFRCMVDGQHLQIGTEQLQKLIVDFSEVGSSKYKDNLEYAKKYCKFTQ